MTLLRPLSQNHYHQHVTTLCKNVGKWKRSANGSIECRTGLAFSSQSALTEALIAAASTHNQNEVLVSA